MTYLLPTTVDSALEALANGQPTIVAGATDYYPTLIGGTSRDAIVDITRLDDLRGVSHDDGRWRIGSLTTWTDIAHANLPDAFAGLQAAATQVGGVQIQNVASVAGNLCNASPAADGVPPLLTLEAQIEMRSAGRTRVIDLADFIVGNRATTRRPEELVTAIIIPDPPEATVGSFEKLGSRSYLVISIVMVAALAEVDPEGTIRSLRLAVGACSPVARRLNQLEADLAGTSIHDPLEDLITPDHLAPLSPIDDVRASAEYRLAVTPTLIARAMRACSRAER